MEISYKDIQVSTDADLAITYHHAGTIDDFIDNVLDRFEQERCLAGTAGFVSSRFPFLANLNLIENIILPLEFHRNMNEDDARENVAPAIRHLGIEGVVNQRKESVTGYDLLKAMSARATSMGPELVFFIEPHHFVPLRVFSSFLREFRGMPGRDGHIWVALEEGMKLSWDHDSEVALDG